MTLSGSTIGLNAGNYEAIFTLKKGYCWNDGTTSPKTIIWTIDKA
jgi:hypothetical protein